MTGNSGMPPGQEAAFLPLGQIENDIYARRSARGLPVFKDLQDFSGHLQQLAVAYTRLRQQAQQSEERRARYRAIEKAAHQLQIALNALQSDETGELGKQQKQCFTAHLASLTGEEHTDLGYVYDAGDEPFKPRLVEHIQQWGDLHWLQSAAERLSRGNKRGRQVNTVERWAAVQFVVMCHRAGWSPVQVANSGIEKRSGVDREHSDAVRCLAAVFAEGKIAPALCLTQAHSALRSIRTSFIHVEQEAIGPDDYELVYYDLSLQNMRSELWRNLDLLPNFRPD